MTLVDELSEAGVGVLVDQICDAFEEAWRSESSPAIEAYLQRVAEPHRAVLFTELLLSDCECRRRRGEQPRTEDYLSRFPERAAVVQHVFAQLEAAASDRGLATTVCARANARTRPNDAASALPPGGVAGYELLEELGRGGMGVVYKARQTALRRLVAIKMLLAGSHASSEQRARFRREAEAAARLRHPNIVQVYETREEGGHLCVAMEYVAGSSLDHLLSTWHAQGQAGLTAPQAAQLVQTLATAAHVAHMNGIVHRDLKPANILLEAPAAATNVPAGNPTQSGPLDGYIPKIADFGLAKLTSDEPDVTRTGVIIGTPTYMAPEQVEAKPSLIGPHTDVYALGTILFELLTGRTPFRAATMAEIFEQVRNEDPPLPSQLQPNLPRDLETIALKCLRKDPRQRYASAEALAQDLGRFLNGEPIAARRTGLLERAVKWTRRRPAVAALLAIIVAITFTAFAIVLWQLHLTDQALSDTEKSLDEKNKALQAKTIALDDKNKALQAKTIALEEKDTALARRDVALARAHWVATDIDQARTSLAEVPLRFRDADWANLDRACQALVRRLELKRQMTTLCWHADGARLFGQIDTSSIATVDVRTGTWKQSPLPRELNHPGRITPVNDGLSLYVVGSEKTPSDKKKSLATFVQIFDLQTDQIVGRAPVGEIYFPPILSSNGERLAVEVPIPPNKSEIRVVEIATGKLINVLNPAGGLRLAHICLSNDGKRLTYPQQVLTKDGMVVRQLDVWDVDAGRVLNVLRRPTLPGQPANAWPEIGNRVEFTPDGRRLLYMQHESLTKSVSVKLWDIETGSNVTTISSDYWQFNNNFAVSPDGKTIANGGNQTDVVYLREITGGEPLILRGHRGRVIKMAFSPDSRQLATLSLDGVLCIWNVNRRPS